MQIWVRAEDSILGVVRVQINSNGSEQDPLDRLEKLFYKGSHAPCHLCSHCSTLSLYHGKL